MWNDKFKKNRLLCKWSICNNNWYKLKEKFLHSRIKGAIHYEYNRLVDDINNIYKRGKISYEFRKIFSNKDKIYIFYCDKGAMSLVICEKMSGLGYICKTVVGGFEAYKGMCVIN